MTYLEIFPAGPPPPPTDNCVFVLRTVKKILITAISENSSFLAKSLLQFSLAGFGDLCHISGQCRTGKVRQSDLVLVHLTKSSHQYRRKVGLAVIVGAADDESLPPLRVDGSGASFPRLILALLSRGVIPIDGSQHQTRRHH